METKQLRSGYTTGTCAAAAAQAAACFMFTGKEETMAELMLPAGKNIQIAVKKHEAGRQIWFAVQKDAGDDPDVTNGIWVYASIEPFPEAELETVTEGAPRTIYHSEEYPALYLTGGPGIGIVTKPGLSCPMGAYAINPVPRSMIFTQVGLLYEQSLMNGNYLIRIMIPEGVETAKKTFNPKLGIEGGISVLGTSGIVNPMSEQALVDTIRLEIHMKAAAGQKSIILVPGNYGEQFLKEHLGLSLENAVHCSNFVAESLSIAASEGMKKLLFVGHIGKLIKVAGGVKNTHSRYGDRRMEILSLCIENALTQIEEKERLKIQQKILACNTTEEAIDCLDQFQCRDAVMDYAVRQILHYMKLWSVGKIEIGVLMFSSVHGVLGKSRYCNTMIEEWRAN